MKNLEYEEQEPLSLRDHPCFTDPPYEFDPPNPEEQPERINTTRLALSVTRGIIPLWEQGVNLTWALDRSSFSDGGFSESQIEHVRSSFKTAIESWGSAAPIDFDEVEEDPKMKICFEEGLTHFAKAFFPDESDRRIIIFKRFKRLPKQEKIELFIHELGHVFGLKHTFSLDSVVFGDHDSFSIMRPDLAFSLKDQDKADLKRLYNEVWSGQRDKVQGISVKLFNTDNRFFDF